MISTLQRLVSPMRRAIAAATQQAWQAIPHVALQSHANVDSLVQRRAPLTAAIARATAKALQQHPAFNGQLVGNGFAACADVHLGIAVATPDGLVTAVVRNAERSSVTELNDAIGKLAADARTGRLDGARTLGATFTISSTTTVDVVDRSRRTVLFTAVHVSEGQENVAVAATMEVTEEEYYDEFEDEVTIKLGKSWQ